MVQDFGGTPQVVDPSLPAESGGKTGFAGFISTTLGKLVIGGVLVLVLAGILGAIAVFYLFSQADSLVNEAISPAPGSIQTSSVAEVAPAEREAPRLEDTFTFRNIFAPTVKPSVPESDTASGDGTGTPGASVPQDTLFLESVSVIDGDTVATLTWNGTTFVVGEGEDLEGTPWRVLDINGASVTMLYGDTSVTLTVGQALGK